MTGAPEQRRGDGADELRAALRQGLTGAMKARDRDAAAALRAAIAAVDNAQAVAAPPDGPAGDGAHVAGAVTGLGAAEVPRRALSAAEADAVLRALVTEQASAAVTREALGRPQDARRLRAQAALLSGYLLADGDPPAPGPAR